MRLPGSTTIGFLLAAWLCATPVMAPAQAIYRSVDEKGRVTFSDQPPADARQVERVNVEAQKPSDSEVEAAKRRHEEVSKAAAGLAEKRRKAEEERRRQEEEQRKRALEEPQVIVIERNDNRAYWPYPVRPVKPLPPPGQRPPVVSPPVVRPPAGRPPAPTPLPTPLPSSQ